jgi:hypothetical protein
VRLPWAFRIVTSCDLTLIGTTMYRSRLHRTKPHYSNCSPSWTSCLLQGQLQSSLFVFNHPLMITIMQETTYAHNARRSTSSICSPENVAANQCYFHVSIKGKNDAQCVIFFSLLFTISPTHRPQRKTRDCAWLRSAYPPHHQLQLLG